MDSRRRAIRASRKFLQKNLCLQHYRASHCSCCSHQINTHTLDSNPSRNTKNEYQRIENVDIEKQSPFKILKKDGLEEDIETLDALSHNDCCRHNQQTNDNGGCGGDLDRSGKDYGGCSGKNEGGSGGKDGSGCGGKGGSRELNDEEYEAFLKCVQARSLVARNNIDVHPVGKLVDEPKSCTDASSLDLEWEHEAGMHPSVGSLASLPTNHQRRRVRNQTDDDDFTKQTSTILTCPSHLSSEFEWDNDFLAPTFEPFADVQLSDSEIQFYDILNNNNFATESLEVEEYGGVVLEGAETAVNAISNVENTHSQNFNLGGTEIKHRILREAFNYTDVVSTQPVKSITNSFAMPYESTTVKYVEASARNTHLQTQNTTNLKSPSHFTTNTTKPPQPPSSLTFSRMQDSHCTLPEDMQVCLMATSSQFSTTASEMEASFETANGEK